MAANHSRRRASGMLLGRAAFAKSWHGTVQWTARSPFRPERKRKNWFVGISVIHPPEETRFDAKDIRWEVMRASGPGRQPVNKTESAVRVTHIARSAKGAAARRQMVKEVGGSLGGALDTVPVLREFLESLQASASEERSQHCNRKLALARLADRIRISKEKQNAGKKEELWRRHRELERGNPVRVLQP